MADLTKMVNTTEYVKFGSNKTPYHRNKGRWLNKPTRGAVELNFIFWVGHMNPKGKDGRGVTPKDIVDAMGLCGFHTTEVSVRASFGHWRTMAGEKCLVFENGKLIGATDAPRPDYLEFTYGTGPKRWKREGMNKKVKVVVNDAPESNDVIPPYDPKEYTR